MKRRLPIFLLAALMLLALAGCEDATPVLAGTPTPAATATPLPEPFTAEITAAPLPTGRPRQHDLRREPLLAAISRSARCACMNMTTAPFSTAFAVSLYLPLDGEVESSTRQVTERSAASARFTTPSAQQWRDRLQRDLPDQHRHRRDGYGVHAGDQNAVYAHAAAPASTP
ncbi:MAG: hypothetical protein R2912_07000 [Eubacteriales bacterium]